MTHLCHQLTRARLVIAAGVGMLLSTATAFGSGSCTCSYSPGAAPYLTSWPSDQTVQEGATASFSAAAHDADTLTQNCNGNITTTYPTDCTMCEWSVSGGTALNGPRTNTLSWRAPVLGQHECEREITITVAADDCHTSNPCPCGTCGGNRNDGATGSRTFTVTVVRPLVCDSDGNGTNEDCKHCDHDGNGSYEACYKCDLDNDGEKDACWDCDRDNNGSVESCRTKITNKTQLQACSNLVQIKPPSVGLPSACTKVPDNPCGLGNTSFSACCAQHDREYSTCGFGRLAADQNLYQCAVAKCNSVNNPTCTTGVKCTTAAWAYYIGVRGLGGGPYCDAQIEFCDCCD